MSHKITQELLEKAYKKLKSYLFTNKTLLQEKIDLAIFEEELKDNIDELIKAIINKDISKWIEAIDYTLVPKKLEDKTKENAKKTFIQIKQLKMYMILNLIISL